MRLLRALAVPSLAVVACTVPAIDAPKDDAGARVDAAFPSGLVAKAAPSPNETHVWIDRTAVLPGRLAPAVTDQPNRGRVLLYGGWNIDSGVRSDTWEWDGDGWLRRTPQDNPGPRFASGVAFDEVGQRVLLYGGLAAFSPSVMPTDLVTWEWNGANWAPIVTQHQPGYRAASAMAFDPGAKRTYLFGGFVGTEGNATDAISDDAFFVFDGKDWSQIPKSGDWPTPRGLGAMAVDRRTGELVLHGGLDRISFKNGGLDFLGGTKYVRDTWIWNGTAWRKSQAVLDAFGAPAIASEPGTGELLLSVDGILGSGLYALEDDQWKLRQPRDADRIFTASSWSSRNAAMLVTGGALRGDDGMPETTSARGDLLGSSARPFTLLPDPVELRARSYARTATVRSTGHVLLFGGNSEGSALGEPVLWTGGRWTSLTFGDPHPSARTAYAIAPLGDDSLVVFGGITDVALIPETWIWNEPTNTWTLVEGNGPPARINGALAALGNDRVVLFGGDAADENAMFGDTWVFSRADGWRQASPTGGPPARTATGLTPSLDGKSVLLFGGYIKPPGAVGDSWRFDGTAWTALQDHAPLVRIAPGFATDPQLGRVLLVGGSSASGQADTWDFTGDPIQPVATRLTEDNQEPPGRRNLHGFSPNPVTGGMLMVGGTGNENRRLLADTWQLALFGASCTQSSECSAGQSCTDGVCCEASSCGPCRACNTPGAFGLCRPRGSAGPEPGCDGEGQSCSIDGRCRLANEQTCGADEACASGTCLVAGRDAGVCCEASGCAVQCVGNDLRGPDGTVTSCGAYGCETDRCRVACASVSDCAEGYVCNEAAACVRTDTTSEDAGGCSCEAAGRRRVGLGGGALAWLAALAVLAVRRGRRAGDETTCR